MDLDTIWQRIVAFLESPIELGSRSFTPMDVGMALLIVLLTIFLAKFIEGRVTRALARGDDPQRESSARATARLLYYVLLIAGIATSVNVLGVQLSALFAAGAIFAVGLGFGLQNLVQDFVSGVLLLGERVIKPGDILEVDGEMVRVEKMGLRSTVARTLDEEQVIVPNEQLVQSKVKNYTLSDTLYRLRVQVGVAYSSDLEYVFEVLEKAAKSVSTSRREPRILLEGFGASSIDFEASIWIRDPWRKKPKQSELAFAIWKHFKEADIEIAFPQLDIHLDEDVLAALQNK